MTYRTPILTGDRVALAPHTDLWMAGVRFGTVRDIRNEGIRRVYLVAVSDVAAYWFALPDLLGAVGPTQAEREAGK